MLFESLLYYAYDFAKVNTFLSKVFKKTVIN